MTRRVDRTGFGDLKIVQDPEAFCYGVDAVLLAGFTADILQRNRKCPGKLMDLGTGNGIVPLILTHKTEIPDLHGMEFQENNVRLAEETVKINGMDERMQIWHADVSDVLADMKAPGESGEEKSGWKTLRGTFDAVTSNPPYTRRKSGAVSQASAKALARHETTADLSMFLELAARLLKEKGDLFMVHRPLRLVDLLTEGRRFRLETKDLQMVSGHEGEKPNIVLVHMVKGGGVELNVFPQLAVRDKTGNYTDRMKKIYEKELDTIR
ncbi:MAG: tRNA1(Val) (adenine(37)-N6)-methyltransferase [Eubacterium sp.]